MIYLASPYSHPDPLIRKTRFLLAEQVTAILMLQGVHVYSPIVHCHAMAERHVLPTDFQFWGRYNIDMLRRADALYVLMIDGHMTSLGVNAELACAKYIQLPIYEVDEEGNIEPWQE